MKRDKHPVAPSSPFREDLVAISQRPVKDATGNLVTLRKNVTRETAEALVERAERHVAAENFDAAMLDLETALAMDVPTPANAAAASPRAAADRPNAAPPRRVRPQPQHRALPTPA